MLTVFEALELVAQSALPLAARSVPLGEALGTRLAEAIVSDIDSPPFDKSMLDGYAIDVQDSSPNRQIVEEVIAGGVPHHSVKPGTTIRVMTGAPMPEGANAVVKHEDTSLMSDTTVKLPDTLPHEGYGIFLRGSSFHAGEEVLPAGKRLRSIDLALLAEVGCGKVEVVPHPRVAVLATGNELVECGESLAPGQIRNSNSPMLVAALREVGATPVELGIARDDPGELKSAIETGLEADVLLITGGVSAGVMDLVPGILTELGVTKVFHKVRMKPGKPLWYGVRELAGHRTLVFGLPGNPVSTLVSFVLFVKPSLTALGGAAFEQSPALRGTLTTSAIHRGGRPTYHPCQLGQAMDASLSVRPLPWRGSADLAALTRANGLIVLPAGDYELTVGTAVEVMRL
ncbi:molybdopterin molybdotransferase MoeA [Bythopirellula polymerisocia]|uniref:Molybdopterin molybdenumtransferase n=1 Tax=Bythopirellula polymerisocia TaxID=2528003 RepID=A0A5C6CWE4_9BACT|nr:gephyrin-like molybdotransferase Glp [Bythopirellula polymerisocia]TWU29303.1 Molybdopterin molybdenumtransferase [Bythopirellula polymerisocia]